LYCIGEVNKAQGLELSDDGQVKLSGATTATGMQSLYNGSYMLFVVFFIV